MKYAFIVNPVSGKGGKDNIVNKINEIIESSSKDVKLYYTRGPKDATVLADMIASEAGDEQVVIFACGGDGTVNEVANGLVGHENAVLGVVPVGSGNDLVRELGGGMNEGEKFLDLDRQLNGEIMKMDLIKLSYMKDNNEVCTYVVNGINIGFDGHTAILANYLKSRSILPGQMSYIGALVANLITKKGESLRVTADGDEIHNGPLLLTTAANGGFCGGGFNSCPHADLYDGLLELLIVRDIKRREFLGLVPKYKAGKILEVPGVERFIKYTQAKEIIFEPVAAPTMKFVGDGELFECGALKVETAKQAIWVNLPGEA